MEDLEALKKLYVKTLKAYAKKHGFAVSTYMNVKQMKNRTATFRMSKQIKDSAPVMRAYGAGKYKTYEAYRADLDACYEDHETDAELAEALKAIGIKEISVEKDANDFPIGRVIY